MADNVGELMQEAQSLIEVRDYAQAIEKLNKVVELDPGNVVACSYLARLYTLRGKVKSVLSIYFKMMDIYIGQGDTENALNVAYWILQLRPDSDEVRLKVIEIYRAKGDTAEVVARSRELARLYIVLDQGDRSIALLQGAIEAEPDNLDLGRELAEMFLQYGRVQEGADQYRTVAQAYQRRGDFANAVDCYSRLKLMLPDDPNIVFILGQLNMELGNYKEAAQDFRATLRFNFENVEALLALGDVCQRFGPYRDAKTSFRKVLDLNPDDVDTRQRLAEVYHLDGDTDDAVKAYLQAGMDFQRFGEKDKAVVMYQRVLSLDASNPTATRELTNLGAPVEANDGGIKPQPKTAAKTKAEPKKGSKARDKETGAVRMGLVRKDGTGGRAGLALKGGLKPQAGGAKPVLGGSSAGAGAPRPGLVRPGLVAPGGAKPTLGGGKRMLKRTLKKEEQPQEPVEETTQKAAQEQASEVNAQTQTQTQAQTQTQEPKVQEPVKEQPKAEAKPKEEVVEAQVVKAKVVEAEIIKTSQIEPGKQTSGAQSSVQAQPSQVSAPVRPDTVAPVVDEMLSTQTPSATPVAAGVAEPDFTPRSTQYSQPVKPSGSMSQSAPPRPTLAQPSKPLITAKPGQLQVPSPTLFLERTDLLDAIRQQILSAPDENVLPWEPLAEYDAQVVEEARQQKEEEQKEQAAHVEQAAGPVASQFGDRGGEGFSFSDGPGIMGVSGGRRRISSKAETSTKVSGSSNKLGVGHIAERLARMRADKENVEEHALDESGDGENGDMKRTIRSKPASTASNQQPTAKRRTLQGGQALRSIEKYAEEHAQENREAEQENTPEETAQAPQTTAPPKQAPAARGLLAKRIAAAKQAAAEKAVTEGEQHDPAAEKAAAEQAAAEKAAAEKAAAEQAAAIKAAAEKAAAEQAAAIQAAAEKAVAEQAAAIQAAAIKAAAEKAAAEQAAAIQAAAEKAAAEKAAAEQAAAEKAAAEKAAAEQAAAEKAAAEKAAAEQAAAEKAAAEKAAAEEAAAQQAAAEKAAAEQAAAIKAAEEAAAQQAAADVPEISAKPEVNVGAVAVGALAVGAVVATTSDVTGNLEGIPAEALKAQPQSQPQATASVSDDDLYGSSEDDLYGDPISGPDTLAGPAGELFGAPTEDGAAQSAPIGAAPEPIAQEIQPEPNAQVTPSEVAKAPVSGPSSEPSSSEEEVEVATEKIPANAKRTVVEYVDEPNALDVDSDQSAEVEVIRKKIPANAKRTVVEYVDDPDAIEADLDEPVEVETEIIRKKRPAKVKQQVVEYVDDTEEQASGSEPDVSEPQAAVSAEGETAIVEAPAPQPQSQAAPQTVPQEFVAKDGVMVGAVAVGALAVGAVVATTASLTPGQQPDEMVINVPQETIDQIEQQKAQEAEGEPEADVRPAETLCSLKVESEMSKELLEEALQVRDKLVGSDVTTSIGSYRRAIEESPDNILLRTDLADLHLRYGLIDDAISQYRQILRRKPDSVALRHRLADAYLWNAEYDEAANTFLELADLHVKNGQNEDAQDVLQLILSLDPQDFMARKRLVERFTETGQTDLAIHHLRQLAETSLAQGNAEVSIGALKQLMTLSDDSSFQERLAQVYEGQGNLEEAMVHYRQLAGRYEEDEKWAEAVTVLEKIVAIEPDNFQDRRELITLYGRIDRADLVLQSQFDLAGRLYEQDKLQEAVDLYEQVIVKDPDFFDARRRLVDCRLKLNDTAGALAQVGTLSDYYETQHLPEPAVELYQQLIVAEPNSVELREALIKFYNMLDNQEGMFDQLLKVADLHEEVESYREAVKCLRRALELNPKRDDLHYRLARLYDEKIGSVSGAMEELKVVYELNPANTDAMARYARHLMDQRKAKASAEVLIKLISVNKESGKETCDNICAEYKKRIDENPTDSSTRFIYGELCYNLNRIEDAVEQFQKTRQDRDYELRSWNMLGQAFIKSPRFGLDMAVRQFRRGLETKGHAEQDYLELRYNLAMLLYQNGRLQEAYTEFKDILAFDVAYRDAETKVKEIQDEIAGVGAGKVRLRPKRTR